MRKTLIAILVISSLSMATLLNTTDQVFNSEAALGGNAAVNAHNKAAGLELGGTYWDHFTQSKGLMSIGWASGTDKAPDNQLLSDMYLQYTKKLDNGDWLGVGYSSDRTTVRSNSMKDDATKLLKYKQDDYNTSVALAATYGREFSRGLYLGAELAFNKDTEGDMDTFNKALKDAGRKDADLPSVSDWYTSLALGGIYDLDAKSKLTFQHKISAAKLWDQVGKDMNDVEQDTQMNEDVPAETSIGYIYKLNNDVDLAGAVTMYGAKSYVLNRSDNGAYMEADVEIIGFNKYMIASEYRAALPLLGNVGFLKGVVWQCYYTWANAAEKFTSDSVAAVGEGVNITGMGLNATKKLDADQSIILGIARTNRFDYVNISNTDETDFYVNYRKAL